MAENIPPQLASSVQRYFEDRDSPIAQVRRELDGMLGSSYPLRVDWAIIREAIAPNVLADDAIVPRLSDCLTTFLRALITLLQSNANNFRSNFLSATSAQYIQVLVHPHPNGVVPFTRLNTRVHTLELYLPRHRLGYASNLQFGEDLEERVNAGMSSLDPMNSPGPVPTSGHEHGIEGPRGSASLARSWSQDPTAHTPDNATGGTNLRRNSRSWEIPTAASLPPPSQLLQKSAIYIRVTQYYSTCAVEGYKPVVDLLVKYINRHSNSRQTEKAQSVANANLEGCANTSFHLGSTVVLLLASVLESSLGFERLTVFPRDKNNEVDWLFRRDVPRDISAPSHQNTIFPTDN